MMNLPSGIEARARIERILHHPFSWIPDDLRPRFLDYQLKNYRRLLLWFCLLGAAFFWLNVISDAILRPEVLAVSMMTRTIFVIIYIPAVLAIFRWANNIRFLDMMLPLGALSVTFVWLLLIFQTDNPAMSKFLFVPLIIIIVANLVIQVSFWAALINSLLIAIITLIGVYHLNHAHHEPVINFFMAYLPVFLFSVFIAWNNTLDKRRIFLRSVLEAMMRQELSQANETIQKLAHTDALTGAHNRRHFEVEIKREVMRSQRNNQPLSLLLMDIDHFKQVNDRYGHDVGDKVLQALSVVVQKELRECDLLVRLGGEEFVVLLSGTALAAAERVAERIRLDLAACAVSISTSEDINFTVSIGVAELNPQTYDAEAMIKAADNAMYMAKNNGRNQVRVAV